MNQIESLPDQLRSQADESLFFTAHTLLGFDRLTEHLHYEMCAIVEAAEILKRVLMLVPRDHYKTSCCTISYPVWCAMRDPNRTGLIVANTATNAMRFGAKIRSAWEKKVLLRQLYPHLRPELSPRWNKEEMCLPRTMDHVEATWTFAGWNTKVTSQHFDYIIYDDLVDEETYDSIELMAKLTDKFEQRIGCLRPPIEDCPIIVVMNHWSDIDLACHIMDKHPEYHVYYRQAIEGGKPIFPEAYSLDWLQRQQEINPYVFATQWMNNPTDPSVAENKPQWLQKYKRTDTGVVIPPENGGEPEEIPLRRMNIVAAVDPRHSLAVTTGDKLTSRNAIVVAGIDPRGRRFVLDEYAERSDPVTLVKKMSEMWRKWEPHGLYKMLIESFGFQAALKPLAEEIWRNENTMPNLELTKRDTTRSKTTRIRGSYGFFRKMIAYSHKAMVAFNEEFLTFDKGKTKDVGDAWAWCMDAMDAPESDDDYLLEQAQDAHYAAHRRSKANI